ncbi:uracil-DNA glycosylase [Sulfurisoma sediminicola]|uniref:Type-4 uracil-DNA glycosylase n=1 Tax=Sulfurisoma sediminicola TaxID=1381557 RepID=A0A497XCY8_9PROT|nr:uracil-DNA glycosylase [Sulfurisoma sediminicola]RLJ64813.1 DNA polymerase [Sulfurisoma sediminicola]
MDRHDSTLREMGLGPLWRLRDAQPAAVPEPARPEAKAVPAPSPTLAAGEGRGAAIAAMDWDELRGAVAACDACMLCRDRQQAVLGVGDVNADWLFIGEGPGAEEDERGEPFVGQAGKLLDAMLSAIDLRRFDDVYIANVVKCRPPGNRTPQPEETAACWPYLERQIALLQPKLIVALGRPAAQTLLQAEVKVGESRGRLFDFRGIPLIVTYHPAYLLRSLPDKAKAWEDLCFMRRTMRQLKGDAAPR